MCDESLALRLLIAIRLVGVFSKCKAPVSAERTGERARRNVRFASKAIVRLISVATDRPASEPVGRLELVARLPCALFKSM